MKLAIVGSTTLNSTEAMGIIDAVIKKYQPTYIVSGGAPGVDTLAEVAARQLGLVTEIYRPRRQQWSGAGGFQERNQQIAAACDRLVRIVSKDSKTYGSGWTRDRAAELGKPTEEYVL